MTTKLLQEKCIRSRTFLPERISSYSNHIAIDTINVLDAISITTSTASSGSNSGSNKCIANICRCIHLLSTMIYFCSPLVLIREIYDSKIASIATLGLMILKIFVLDLFLYKMGKIQNWLKKVSEINK
jgi:hypothetical protein